MEEEGKEQSRAQRGRCRLIPSWKDHTDALMAFGLVRPKACVSVLSGANVRTNTIACILLIGGGALGSCKREMVDLGMLPQCERVRSAVVRVHLV